MTDTPTQAPTDSAVEPAGLSEARLLELRADVQDELIVEIDNEWNNERRRVRRDHVKAIDELLAARQELAATRTQLAAREAECRVKERALTSLSKQLAEMRGALEDIVDERRTDEDGIYHRLSCTADMVEHAAAALASPSQPSRGKCETCFAPISNPRMDCAECTARMDCAQPERQGVTFYRCTFEGNPPAPHSNWMDWAASRMYTNVLIMAHEFGLPVPDAFKEKQPEPSPALREAAKAGAEELGRDAKRTRLMIQRLKARGELKPEHGNVERDLERMAEEQEDRAALLDAFAEGK